MKTLHRGPNVISSVIKTASVLTILVASSAAIAGDYSVGIVGLNFFGTSINLYRTGEKKVELVQEYVLQPAGETINRPLALVTSLAHDFVYVAYLSSLGTLPNIVGLKITPYGLVKEWEHTLNTGDAFLQGTTLLALDDYVIENTYPFASSELSLHVLTRAGREVVLDQGSNGSDLVSGHLDPHKRFYYSCREAGAPANSVKGPANTVVVYDLDRGDVDFSTPPLLTSTDPTYVQSICTL